MLEKIKIALRITTNIYDTLLTSMIDEAKLDLGIAGVSLPTELDALCQRAIITYCKVYFPEEPDDRLKAAYDEQKAQLSMATGYTNWSV